MTILTTHHIDEAAGKITTEIGSEAYTMIVIGIAARQMSPHPENIPPGFINGMKECADLLLRKYELKDPHGLLRDRHIKLVVSAIHADRVENHDRSQV